MRLQADAFAQYGEVHEADAIMLMLRLILGVGGAGFFVF